MIEFLFKLAMSGTALVAPPFTTTMTVSEDGRNDDLATTTAVLYTSTSVGASVYSNIDGIKKVFDAIAYVESCSQAELIELDSMLQAKSLDFELPATAELLEKPKVLLKTIQNK
ncbi:MAG: hypothetical protein IJA30_06625 [Bacilli bacterium]|nr:hypothetical protein [Bacilli bacterium]